MSLKGTHDSKKGKTSLIEPTDGPGVGTLGSALPVTGTPSLLSGHAMGGPGDNDEDKPKESNGE